MTDDALSQLTPSLVSYSIADSQRELFKRTADPAFALVAAADTAAGLTFDALLDPVRAARLVEFNRRDNANLGFEEVLDTITRTVMQAPPMGREGEIARAVQMRYAYGLMDLASGSVAPTVKARAIAELAAIQKNAARRNSEHAAFLSEEIQRFNTRTAEPVKAVTPEKALPPGSPIGSGTVSGFGQYEMCWHCD